MSEAPIKRFSRDDISRLGPGKTDWDRVGKLTDKEIEAAVVSDPDAVPLDVDWSEAELAFPARKKAVSIRLDEDVLTFFKRSGPRYQTRINDVLRSFMKHQQDKKKA